MSDKPTNKKRGRYHQEFLFSDNTQVSPPKRNSGEPGRYHRWALTNDAPAGGNARFHRPNLEQSPVNDTDDALDEGSDTEQMVHDGNFEEDDLGLESEEEEQDAEGNDDDEENEAVDGEGENMDNDPEGDEPIYEGAGITKSQSLLLILAFSLRHKLTIDATRDLLQLFNVHYPHSVPRSLHLFNKALLMNTTVDRIYLCKGCNSIIDDADNQNFCQVAGCDEPFNKVEAELRNDFFFNMDLQHQLHCLLDRKRECIEQWKREHREDHVVDTVCDIRDGTQYATLQHSGDISEEDLTLSWNCDGAPIYKSSKYSIWPIQCCVNELPPSERRLPQNLLMAALYFGKTKPCMPSFLEKFVGKCRQLSLQGLVRPEGIIKVHTILCSCDTIARPLLSNTSQFNGIFGCDWCKHPGEMVERGDGHSRVYSVIMPDYPAVPETNPPIPLIHTTTRKHNDHVEEALLAEELNIPIHGVKGTSELLTLPNFNIIKGFVVDPLHCIFLGVMRQLMSLWLDTTNHNSVWYIGRKIDDLDSRLRDITPPSEITRTPRTLTDRRFYKGSEFRSFLLFYGFYVLENILPHHYYSQFLLLSWAIHILSNDIIPHADIVIAENLIQRFVSQMEELYGKEHMTYNVHQLTHLVDSVKQWGPLWGFSSMTFEAGNGMLAKLHHGTQHVPLQICKKFMLWKGLPIKAQLAFGNVNPNIDVALSAKALYEKLYSNLLHTFKADILDGGVICTGKPTLRHFYHNEELAVQNLLQDDRCYEQVCFYSRCIVNKMIVTSDNYDRAVKRSNTCVQLSDSRIVVITYLVKLPCINHGWCSCRCENLPIFLCHPLTCEPHYRQRAKRFGEIHIKITGREMLEAIPCTHVVRKCVSFNSLCIPLPNPYERD